MSCCQKLVLIAAVALGNAHAQTLPLPSRPATAPGGSQFTNIVATLSRDERENWIYAQVITGNVPDWWRTLKPINAASPGHTATYHVTPDYLAIGSEADYFLSPCTPILAQRMATQLGCSLPTRRMVDQIWTNATVKLNPQPIAPSAEMITVPVFAWHNFMVRTQRNSFTNSQPLGALVSGNKKDVILSNEITTRPPPRVVIYGWHYTSGEAIQPLSAVHEETYADYSHGIRLVHQSMTADGSANTVSNVLKSAALNPLLSDEGAIPLPYYSVAPLAPVVMTHPRSQTVWPGTNITLNTLVISDSPLACRWLLNGVNISGATNSSFAIPDTQSSNAGYYSVIVTNGFGSATSRVATVRVRTTDFPVLFTDDFETNPATNWNVFWGAANGIPDYTADFSFDYGVIPYTFNGVTALIPPSPNSTDQATRGVRLTANNNDANGSTAAVNLYPRNFSVAGNFALKFDLWVNYPGNAGGINSTGSTQHALCGINHLGTNSNWAAASATASDGIWFAAAGEGGDSADYRSYVGNLLGTQTNLTGSAIASGLVATNHTAATFQSLFPTSHFETAGAPGKNWIEVELRQTNNILVWLMDGTVVAQRTNSSVFTSGTVMIGLMDTFSSIANPARDSFVIFDNVRVENLAPPIHFDSITRLTNGNISLSLNSTVGDRYWLDTTTNLNSWQPLTAIIATNNPVSFLDTGAAGNSVRYYRARR